MQRQTTQSEPNQRKHRAQKKAQIWRNQQNGKSMAQELMEEKKQNKYDRHFLSLGYPKIDDLINSYISNPLQNINREMLNPRTQKTLSTLHKLCDALRERQASMGFSHSESDQTLLSLAVHGTATVFAWARTAGLLSNTKTDSQKERHSELEEKLTQQLKDNEIEISRFLQDLVSRLETALFDIETLEEDELPHGHDDEEDEVDFIASSESNPELELSGQGEHHSENEKVSHLGSTENDSLGNRQDRDSDLEMSLQNLIQRTKMLKAILQKHVLMSENQIESSYRYAFNMGDSFVV